MTPAQTERTTKTAQTKGNDMTAQNASHTAANRAKSALTALLFLSFAFASAVLMRGHANLENNNPDSNLPDNGGNNNPGTTNVMLSPPSGWESWIPTAALGTEEPVTIDFTAKVNPFKKGKRLLSRSVLCGVLEAGADRRRRQRKSGDMEGRRPWLNLHHSHLDGEAEDKS